MRGKLRSTWTIPSTGLRFLVIILIVLGVCFRFVNLDRKVYWCDETYTSLRISGYTAEEFVQNVFDSEIISVESLQKYQRPNPEKNVFDTINGLAAEEPQHSPLYYVMARFWVQVFGSSVAVTRSLSALISLLTFPCLYWLCLELFDSPLIGWISMAMVSVSSFHFLYAQEAREYSLWTVTILLASTSLLQALRKQTTLSWGIYAVTFALSLYSFLFSIWMALGHGIYVVLIKGFRLSKAVIAYFLAFLTAFLLFAPWFSIVLNSYQIYTTTSFVQSPLPIFDLFKIWLRNLSFLFFDAHAFGFPFFLGNEPANIEHSLIFVILPILGLVGYSIYFVCDRAPEETWLFIVTLIGSTALPLALIDLCLGWRLTSILRYLIPSCLGIQLAVAYLLASKIADLSGNFWQQKLWLFVSIALVSGGVLSGAVSSQAQTSWTKSGNYFNPQIADIVNKASQPLLISYGSQCDILSLSYSLNPSVKLLLLPIPILSGLELIIPKIDGSFSDIFLFDPVRINFRYELESQQKDKGKIVYEVNKLRLWKLDPIWMIKALEK